METHHTGSVNPLIGVHRCPSGAPGQAWLI
jgi:hypothetical protein